MAQHLEPGARVLIERCRGIDWRRPRHDPERAAAAYERWLALLGLKRRVEWVTDPAEIPAWQAQAPGMVNAWGALAASNPAGPSVIGMLLGERAGAAWPPPAGDALIAANWAMVVNLHMATVEGTSDLWLGAWTELAAREPALALASVLLSPPFLWPAPAPPTVALAAAPALAACADASTWTVLAEAIARPPTGRGAGAVSPAPFKMPTRVELYDALVATAEPMVDACAAGAFAHVLRAGQALVLAAPSIWTDGRRLHRANGPAIAWPRTRAGAWKGFLLPEGFVVTPEAVTPDAIRAVTGRLQHVLMDIYAHAHGHRRCMQDLGGTMVHEDGTGRLWYLNPARDPRPPEPGDMKVVEVTNGTPERDGSRKTYWLRVPPEVRTAKEAVAWTYGMTPDQYDGLVVRT